MKYVLERIRNIRSYKAPDVGEGEIKLDAQENPYELPGNVKEKVSEALSSLNLNRYPEPGSRKLRGRIASYCGAEAANILIGNGSDELIELLLFACGGPGRLAAAPEPTFAMYKLLSELTGTEYKGVPLEDGFRLPAEKLLSLRPDIIFIAYPNNPTGNCFSLTDIEKLIENAPGLVVIDEAYFEFSKKSLAESVSRNENLVILRTFSKAFSLAGIRAGYLVADAGLTKHLRKAQLPYSFSALNQRLLEVVLSEKDQVLASVEKILDSRAGMLEALKKIKGIVPYESEANFILMKIDNIEGVLTALRRNNIKVREFSEPLLKGFLRVTVGTEEENSDFLKAVMEAQ